MFKKEIFVNTPEVISLAKRLVELRKEVYGGT